MIGSGNDQYIGYSERIHSPEVQAALKKSRRAAGIFFILLILAPIVISLILSVKNDDGSLVMVGFGVSFVFLVINIISFIAQKTKRQWDGTVVDKKRENRTEASRGHSNVRRLTVVVRTDSGSIKKISGSINPYYDYLDIGDKIRYYPQYNNYYEKFDKSGDSYVLCPVCGSKVDIDADRCKRCKVPAIK
ncbi:MAG: hypothetical protein IJR59_00425 [Firmicutes bacterium]|nr:hypothetical protein [Bacillota bacterium]